MAIHNKHILFVIPCYNEQASIVVLLNEVLNVAKTLDATFTIVVVNDNSSDNSLLVLHPFKNIVLLSLPVNLGIGGAMQTGFQYALTQDFDFLIQVDGDGQHPPAEINKLLQAQQNSNANVIIGSRFIHNKGFQSSFFRRMGIRYLQSVYYVLTQKIIKDVTSGFRLYDKKTIALIADKYPDEFPEPDSLVLFSKLNLKIVETPVLMQERKAGVSSIQNFKQLYYIAKVSLSMFFTAIKKV